MEIGQPSRTALVAAAQRAAHQALDGAAVFNDPIAHVFLGQEAEAVILAVSSVSIGLQI